MALATGPQYGGEWVRMQPGYGGVSSVDPWLQVGANLLGTGMQAAGGGPAVSSATGAPISVGGLSIQPKPDYSKAAVWAFGIGALAWVLTRKG